MRLYLLLSILFLAGTLVVQRPATSAARDRDASYCAPSFDINALKKGNAPLIKGLGNLHFAVKTSSQLAQKYFNQGLTLIYAFNHGESARSFRYAAKLDSSMAMAWWGYAMAIGPNYNAALDPTRLEDINEAIANAKKLSEGISKKEKMLIDAVDARYPEKEVSDMGPYAEAYASKMKNAFMAFPGDADIASLYADALMNLHPWNMWNKDGSIQPWTAEIQSLLESILKNAPEHPGAIHLYIHLMEASPFADKATPYADKLRDLLPAAGHLVHMPAHIYIRTGHYHKGVIATEKANVSDSSYIVQCKSQGAYPLLYYPHNIHFLAACAFLEGNSNKAIQAAWSVSRNADKTYMDESATVQHYWIIPYYMLVHLAKWDDILQLPAPPDHMKYPTAIWHYARGMAYLAKSEKYKALESLEKVNEIAADESLKKFLIWESNNVLDLIMIARNILRAEIETSGGDYVEAINILEEAKKIEDGLNYTEPPDWFFSVRHTLGHVQNKAGRYEEAELIYRDDLRNLPENGWALIGLYNSLKGQGRYKEAEEVKNKFDKAWKWADFKINSSRIY